MKYKLIVADGDGTLFAPSETVAPFPSENLLRKVKQAGEKGVLFTIATARSLSWVENLITGFDLKVPMILDNGAQIYDPTSKKYLWESVLSKEDAEKTLSILSEDKALRVFIVDSGERLTDPGRIKYWKISKILVLGITPKKAEYLYRKLSINPNVFVTKSVSGRGEESESIHVTNLMATKKVALEKLLEILDISRDEAIGIGDSYNDLSFLEICGLKVAVGNAVPEVKDIADYVSPPYWEDGVGDVIDKYVFKSKGKMQKSKV